MDPDEITRTIREAHGFAALGLHGDAWDHLEKLPAEGSVRLQQAVITVRLMVCTSLQKWLWALTAAITVGLTEIIWTRRAALDNLGG